ncbi:hypothetical protein [Ureibacillus aquaedulcis]|uniref:HTH luxR-type domain-containing protein n=1 Tax=Ureibacillus aquaedulcis TaxID=3058421 RepID=A0ABT8GU79_9BACL|nr:hypothetical protein [Ureibacillus sp. BA0131]MDN4494929.1 hypothetical protein [Ureibacillus sp. BA0131]
MAYNINKEIEYKPFIISDINVVELLISLRYKYDENMFLENGSMFYITGAKALNQELVATYVSLDETIKKCNFSDKQLKLIKLVEQGYTHREIEQILKIDNSNVTKSLKTIYKTIVDINLREWRKSTYTNTLGIKTKQCSKCKENLPATNEFFSFDKTNNRFKASCKKCR